MKDIDQYGIFTEKMWFSGKAGVPTQERDLPIMALGLAGEVGEVVEHIKHLIRDEQLDKDALKKELGDAVFYWARICKYFGMEPSEVLADNIAKLESRRDRNTLRGRGDNR